MPITIIANNSKGEQILVELNGEKSTITTSGFSGTSCTDATAALEAALGKTVNDTPTGEMWNQTNAKIRVGHS